MDDWVNALLHMIFRMYEDCLNKFSFFTQLKQPKAAIDVIEKLFKIIEPLGK